MKGKTATAALALCSALGAAQADGAGDFLKLNELKYGADRIAVGAISVNYSETIALKPDTAEFSITYITEGATPNAASNQNAKNIGALKQYIKSLGVSESDITTQNYRNYEQSEEKTQFLASLRAGFVMQKEGFRNALKILESHGISNLKSTYKNEYSFEITAWGDTESAAAKKAQNLYDKIENALKTANITDSIGVEKYEVEEERDRGGGEVKKYYSSNEIKIKTGNFDDVGKIYAKAQELKMNINDDLVYLVSEENKQKLISEYESALFKKLQEKAKRLIGGSEYALGAPRNLSVSLLGAQENDRNAYRYRGYNQNSVVNRLNSVAQTQQAQIVDISPPSKSEISITIYGEFDIVGKIKR
jgi:uncharacterized protein YggE